MQDWRVLLGSLPLILPQNTLRDLTNQTASSFQFIEPQSRASEEKGCVFFASAPITLTLQINKCHIGTD